MEYFRSSAMFGIVEGLLNDPTAEVRDSTAKMVYKAKGLFGDSVFKNIEKNVNNKDILQKLMESN